MMRTKTTTQPPSFSDLMRIAFGLTIVCLISALVLGVIFSITEPIKVKNIKAREQQMIQRLLGLDKTAKIEEIRRYLSQSGQLQILYLLPSHLFRFDETGSEIDRTEVPQSVQTAADSETKDLWVTKHLKTLGIPDVSFVGRFIIGMDNGDVLGYVVESQAVGYKAKIRFFVALDHAFSVRGIEIVEHEEDPGLGAEITEPYFKNQFSGRSAQEVASLRVTKDPLPAEWKKALERLGELSFETWLETHLQLLKQNPSIYAITGATISSEAVTKGLKRAIRNFQIRLKTLKEAL